MSSIFYLPYDLWNLGVYFFVFMVTFSTPNRPKVGKENSLSLILAKGGYL